MKTELFRPTPITLAVSTLLLVGCGSDRTIQPSEVVSQPEPSLVTQPYNSTKQSQDRAEQAELEQQRVEHQPANKLHSSPSPSRHLAQTKHKAESVSADIAYHSSLVVPPPAVPPVLGYVEPDTDRERFASFTNNPTKSTADDPLSTFGIDVDTASYSLARQTINHGSLPRPESVRTEEWINYFSYDYPAPENQQTPFSITTEAAAAPWNPDKLLLSIGLQGFEVAKQDLPPLNLTFLIDVSGSMSAPNKLGLARNALRMLTHQLRSQDRVAIVVYAGAAGLVLESTPGDHKQTIISALDRLRAGGSTAGGAGIQLAYSTARSNHQDGAISRVILLSDGDFNVGTTSTEALKQMVAKQRKSGVSLSVLTFGRGNIRDELMNSLAEIGNGNAGYIDSAQEAKKYLVDEMAGSMMTIAKDVKAQIEFNPAVVSEYRLLGYETRHLEHHEFNDDSKDAGEIGAGHEVTALYEVVMHGSPAKLSPQRRYQQQRTDMPDNAINHANELAYLKLRYKQPDQATSRLLTRPIHLNQIKQSGQTSNNFRWSAAVAGAAQHARGVAGMENWTFADSVTLAKTAQGIDPLGYRAEFIRMMELADSLITPIAHYGNDR